MLKHKHFLFFIKISQKTSKLQIVYKQDTHCIFVFTEKLSEKSPFFMN